MSEFAFPLPEDQKRLGDIKPNRDCPSSLVHKAHEWGDDTAQLKRGEGYWCDGIEENRALPVKWADKAMFTAEPMPVAEGPQVHLLWMTPDPLGAIAACSKMYKGEVVRDLSDVTDEERMDYLLQISRTKLKMPFEAVKLHFMIDGVTRGFTHQLVRQRTAAYAQESTRFAVFGQEGAGLPVGLPPSLSGLSGDAPQRVVWEQAVEDIETAYKRLVDSGVPAEDARGLLPTNLLTRIHYITDLRGLLDHAGNRLCTQAQFEWRLVFAQIVQAIRNATITIPRSDGSKTRDKVYKANELSSLFKPVCFQTGKCEFKANFDRACKIRDRVDAFHKAGVAPSQWDDIEGVRNVDNPFGPRIAPIHVREWLMDPSAAREQ